MKKLFLICTAAILMAVPAQAQEKGDMSAGVQVAAGTGDSFTNYGFGAKFRYNVTDRIRVEPSFTYFLEKDYTNMWDLSANVHYLFEVADQITAYPLAGLSYMGVEVSVPTGFGGDISASDSEIGLNLGGGIDYQLNDKITLNAEAKYKIGGDWSRFIFAVGAVYHF